MSDTVETTSTTTTAQSQEEQQQIFERQQRRYTQRLEVPEGEERHSGVVTKFSGTYGFAVVLGGQYDGQTIMINQANILTSRENVYRTLNNGEHIEFGVRANDDGRIQALSVTAPGGYCLLCETNPGLGQRRYPVRSHQGQRRGGPRRHQGQRRHQGHRRQTQGESQQPADVTEE